MVERWGRSALAALGVGLVAWGLGASSARAYTVKQTPTGSVVRWHLTDVAMRIDPSLQRFLPGVAMENVVSKATGAWHGLSGAPELLLSAGEPGPRGYTGGTANNGVYLVEDWELQENALAVTVATFETDSGRIVDADVLVNANHPFGLLPDGPDDDAKVYDIEAVLTHEMGHVLGLGESYDARQATMWPSVATGETHQRDIDSDDQAGIEDAYAAGPLSEAESPAGCGGASVVVKRGRSPVPGTYRWLLLGAAGLALAYWLRARGSLEGPSRLGVPAFALVMLFGAAPLSGSSGSVPVENERIDVLRTLALRRASHAERVKGLAVSVRSESARVRLAAAAVLERAGAHDDLPLASKLLLDEDAEVRRVAGRALERLRTAPPSETVERETPEAQRRLGRLLRGASAVVKGEVVSVGVEERRGLHWSRFLVHGQDEVVEVQIPGGTVGNITQVVSEQEPPADGDSVVVALHAKGAHSWALARNGVVYGGTLGEGPAIRWVP
jgi:Matrixin